MCAVKSNCIFNKVNDIKLAVSAYQEFSDAIDYIWKAPRLLDQEKEKELEKLQTYYPSNPKMAEIRWSQEFKKLNSTFPHLMATGNLFMVASLFETYLILLAKDIEDKIDVKLSQVKGQGYSRIINYFKDIGLPYDSVALYHQVEASLKIRNCLVHAGGLLNWSKDELAIRQVVKSGTFLSCNHRGQQKGKDSYFGEVGIVESKLGDRIEITNEYSWLSCSYFRDYFLGLCIESRKLEKRV